MSTRDLKTVIDKYSDGILKKRNVVGIGVGKDCIRVYVSEKLHLSELMEEDIVQASYDGYKTDVIEVGRIKAFSNPVKDLKARTG